MWRRVLRCLVAIVSTAACDGPVGDADELNARFAAAGHGGASQGGASQGGASHGGVADDGMAGGGIVGAQHPPTPPPIQVDTQVSARYDWSECGRIEAGQEAVEGHYTPDESVLLLESGGRLLLYAADAALPATLLPPRDDGATGCVHLSPDARLLSARGNLYAASDGKPIGAHTTAISQLATLAPAALPCSETLGFSPDSSLVLAAGLESVCVWEAQTGALRSEFTTVARDRGVSDVALVGREAVVLFRFPVLFRYSLDGELLSQVATPPAVAGSERLWAAAFTPDGQVLLVSYYPESSPRVPDLVAIDVETGSELWRHSIDNNPVPSFGIASDSTVVVLHGGAAFRIADGEQVGNDVSAISRPSPAVGPGGRRRLRRLELLGDWDLLEGKPLRLFGSHLGAIRDLDISRDGRYLASHGQRAVVWRVDSDDFSRSVPLFDGAAPDDSWNVALAPDGQTLAVSGDNLAFFRGDGTWRGSEPASVSANCLSADWAFSPTGAWAAGTHYGEEVEVVDASSLASRTLLPASGCQSGVAFSPDGSRLVTARLELFETTGWRRLRGPNSTLAVTGIGESAVQFSPDGAELVVTRCAHLPPITCASGRYDASTGDLLADASGLSAPRARYSPEGHWLLSGNHLLHVPTARLIEYTADAREALFTPNGDIIAGQNDGSLVRYCRTDEGSEPDGP